MFSQNPRVNSKNGAVIRNNMKGVVRYKVTNLPNEPVKLFKKSGDSISINDVKYLELSFKAQVVSEGQDCGVKGDKVLKAKFSVVKCSKPFSDKIKFIAWTDETNSKITEYYQEHLKNIVEKKNKRKAVALADKYVARPKFLEDLACMYKDLGEGASIALKRSDKFKSEDIRFVTSLSRPLLVGLKSKHKDKIYSFKNLYKTKYKRSIPMKSCDSFKTIVSRCSKHNVPDCLTYKGFYDVYNYR